MLDTCGLDELLPDWKKRVAPITVSVKKDNFYMRDPADQIRITNWSTPPMMSNRGKYIVSMANVCRWKAERAEELGVEIFPGMATSEVVWEGDRLAGVVVDEFFGVPVLATTFLDLLLRYAVFVQIERASYSLRGHTELILKQRRTNAPISPPPSPKRH